MPGDSRILLTLLERNSPSFRRVSSLFVGQVFVVTVGKHSFFEKRANDDLSRATQLHNVEANGKQ